MNNTDQMFADYTKLCGTRTTIESAPNLPTRFKAVLDYQGDLSAFVIRWPEALKRGVEVLVDEDRKRREEAEYARVKLVLKAYGVKQ